MFCIFFGFSAREAATFGNLFGAQLRTRSGSHRERNSNYGREQQLRARNGLLPELGNNLEQQLRARSGRLFEGKIYNWEQ